MTLLERGIIPKDVDLTPAFEKGAPPVAVKSMKFHEKAEKNLRLDVHTEKFNKNTLKFDMQRAKPMPKGQSNALVPYEGEMNDSVLPPLEPKAIEAAGPSATGTHTRSNSGQVSPKSDG